MDIRFYFLFFFAVISLAFFVYFWQKKGNAKSGATRIIGKKTKIFTPTLSMHSRDLTALSLEDKLDPVIGRDEEIGRVIQILSRREKNNPVLVGKAGVGKTAIVEGLAQAIIKGKVPKVLIGKKVLALDLAGIVAGTKYRGEFEQRLKKISDEITSAQRNIVLFIDEIHSLAEAGQAKGAIGAADILKPALAQGDLQVIGATTREEYMKFIAKDPTLDRRLHPILIDEPTSRETLEILQGIKFKYEDYHKVKISDSAIKTAVDIATKHIKSKSFPDKAIDLIDEASSKVSLNKAEGEIKLSTPEVLPKHVKEVFKEGVRDKI